MSKEEISNKIEKLQKEILELEAEAKTIHNYETVFILKKTTSIKQFDIIKNGIKKIVKPEDWQEMEIKKLAYSIQNEKEGFFIKFCFEGTTSNVTELEKFYRECKSILKFIAIKVED